MSLPLADAQGVKRKQPASSGSVGTAQARREIEAAYRAMDAAYSRLDVDGMFAGMAPDCEMINKRGQPQSVSSMRENMIQYFKEAKSAKSRTVITQFSMDKDGATVGTRTYGEMDIIRLRDGATGHLVNTSTSRDFWVRNGAGWRVKRSRELSSTLTVNGHDVPA